MQDIKPFDKCPHREGLEVIPENFYKFHGPKALKGWLESRVVPYELKSDTTFTIEEVPSETLFLGLKCTAPADEKEENSRINVETTLKIAEGVKQRTGYRVIGEGWSFFPMPATPISTIRVSHSFTTAIKIHDVKLLRAINAGVLSGAEVCADILQEGSSNLFDVGVAASLLDEVGPGITTVVCKGNETLTIHSFVLAARCTKFATALLNGETSELAEFTDVPIELLQPVFEYFYSGDPHRLWQTFGALSPSKPANDLAEFIGGCGPFLALAAYLQIPSLVKVCEDWLEPRIPFGDLSPEMMEFIGRHCPGIASRIGASVIAAARAGQSENPVEVYHKLESLPPEFFLGPSRAEARGVLVSLPESYLTPALRPTISLFQPTVVRAAKSLAYSRAPLPALIPGPVYALAPEADLPSEVSGSSPGYMVSPARITKKTPETVDLLYPSLDLRLGSLAYNLVTSVVGCSTGELLCQFFWRPS